MLTNRNKILDHSPADIFLPSEHTDHTDSSPHHSQLARHHLPGVGSGGIPAQQKYVLLLRAASHQPLNAVQLVGRPEPADPAHSVQPVVGGDEAELPPPLL